MAPGAVAPTSNNNLLGGREFAPVTWYKDPGLRKLYFLLGGVIMVSATNGFDGSMMNSLQSVETWTHFNPSNAQRGLANAIMSVGSMCAIPISPWLADWRGRRLAILIGILIMFVGVALQSAAQNFHMFTAARFLIGFGVSIAHGAAPLLVTELSHYQHRARITSLYNTTWYFGSIIAAWTTYGTIRIPNTWAWRIPSILQAAPALVMLSVMAFVPESPRWLIKNERSEEALKILATYHANGDEHDELVQFEYAEIRETLTIESTVMNRGKLSDLWATKGNRHRMIICICAGLFSQLSGNSLVSYYITDILNQINITDKETQTLINGILNIWNMLIACSMAFFVDKFGRRPLFLTSTAGMNVMFICWTIASKYASEDKSKPAGTAVVALIFLYYTFYNLAWSGLLVGYTVEILPFEIRARGMAVMFFFVNLALFFNNYVNPVALADIKWKYYIVYDIWLLIEFGFVYFFFVETRYTPLEEIAAYFGDNVVNEVLEKVPEVVEVENTGKLEKA